MNINMQMWHDFYVHVLGIVIQTAEGTKQCQARIVPVTCDLPARAMVMCMKQHNRRCLTKLHIVDSALTARDELTAAGVQGGQVLCCRVSCVDGSGARFLPASHA